MEFYYGVLNFIWMRDFTYCKKVVWIITCNSYFAHSEPLFKQLRILKTCDIYKCQLLKCIFKLTHKQLPQYFKEFTFTFRNQLHNYATRTCQNVLIPNINHEFAKRSIRFIAPAAYNSTHGNIIDKIYSHSFVGFWIYVKSKLPYSYNSICPISNCFSCRRNIQWLLLLYLFFFYLFISFFFLSI